MQLILSRTRKALALALATIAAVLMCQPSIAQGAYWQRVIACANGGAITEWTMSQCVGRSVNSEQFRDCVIGNTCLGGPARPARLPKCDPKERGCITGGGITGVDSTGRETTTIANPDGSKETYTFSSLASLKSAVSVRLPNLPGQSNRYAASLNFAVPPIPDIEVAKACRRSTNDEDEFMRCLVEKALPREYRLTRACIELHADDAAAAVVCSSGDGRLAEKYRQVKKLQQCAAGGEKLQDVAKCVGLSSLGTREQYWVNCVAKNDRELTLAAICGLTQDLTPEQQIALSCAASTGGEPRAFAVCTGGRLVERELSKCWSNGIGTESGCFGPNNEIRRYWNDVDHILRQSLGESNDLYRTFVLLKNNALSPGQNHELVRAANTALGDLRRGSLGRNNDIVQAAEVIGKGVQSVSNAVTSFFGL